MSGQNADRITRRAQRLHQVPADAGRDPTTLTIENPPQRWLRSPGGDAGVIYFIQSTMTRHIKIGYAKNPKKRLSGLQTSNADQLKLLGQVNGEMDDEAAFHEEFAKFRLHGEWFKEDIYQQVMAILAKD